MQKYRSKSNDNRGAGSFTVFTMIVMIVALFLALTFGQAEGLTAVL